MSKVFTLEELKALLAKAEQNFANCGCKIYREEADALKTRIKELEENG